MIYDIIGDIHGHAYKLKGLLNQLGYTLITMNSGGQFYQPPANHRAMFIGDLIDRGEQELETLQIVYAMIDAGVADCVMGNHEYNALAYATPNLTDQMTNNEISDYQADKKLDKSIDTTSAKALDSMPHPSYLRQHNNTHFIQHKAFLAEIPFGSALHNYWLQRFYELPLWIETEHACFVHACWHLDKMQILKPLLTPDNRLTPEGLQRTSQKDSAEYDAIERVLKGVELPLPNGVSFSDKDGTVRRHMRVKWWQDKLSGEKIINIARATPTDLAQIPQGATIDYVDFKLQTDKPVFVGHYWMTGTPKPLSPQVVCTDYSAGGKGFLTAYQFDTDNPMPLSQNNFVQFRACP